MTGAKVAILTPIARAPQPEFVTSLIQTLAEVPGCTWIQVTGHANTPRVRNLLAHFGMTKTDAEDFVFIDDDIAWTPDGMKRLLSHPVDIVAGAPQRRSEDATFCGQLDRPDVQKTLQCPDGTKIATGNAATAFMRITRKAFEQLRPTRRVFDYREEKDVAAFFDYDIGPTMSGETGYIGEDFWFCDEARKQGLDVWLDPHIRLKHFHTMPLDLCMADMMRETTHDGHDENPEAGHLVRKQPVFGNSPA